MLNDAIEATIAGVFQTSGGCGIFLKTKPKTFVIYVDPNIGQSIALAMTKVKKDRPLTHDLMGNILKGFDISFERVVINDTSKGTFYARIILKKEDKEGMRLVEVDARPSDAMVMALNMHRPISVAAPVLEKTEDAGPLLAKLSKK